MYLILADVWQLQSSKRTDWSLGPLISQRLLVTIPSYVEIRGITAHPVKSKVESMYGDIFHWKGVKEKRKKGRLNKK